MYYRNNVTSFEEMRLRRGLLFMVRQLNSYHCNVSLSRRGQCSLVRSDFQFFFPHGKQGRYVGMNVGVYLLDSHEIYESYNPLTSRIRPPGTTEFE